MIVNRNLTAAEKKMLEALDGFGERAEYIGSALQGLDPEADGGGDNCGRAGAVSPRLAVAMDRVWSAPDRGGNRRLPAGR